MHPQNDRLFLNEDNVMKEKESGSISAAEQATGGAVTGGVDRIVSGAHRGIDAAAGVVHPAVDRAAFSAHRAVENADELAGHAGQALDGAAVKGEELVSIGTGYVREHPLLTMALAATAGYALSRLFGSR